MKFAIVHEVKELKGKLYFIIKELDLCKKNKNESMTILSGELTGTTIEQISPNPKDDYVGILVDYKNLTKMFCESDISKIIETFNEQCLGKVFEWKENSLSEANEINYVKNLITNAIVGQDEQIEQILSTIYCNQQIARLPLNDEEFRMLKKHIIVSGSTGTGKTEIMNQISKTLNIPIAFYDMANIFNTENSNQFSEIINSLLSKSEYDVETAQKGIVVIDNFEEISNCYSYESPKLMASGIQSQFAKLMEKTLVYINVEEETIPFDTSNLTLVFLGDSKKLKVSSSVLTDIGYNRENNSPEESMINAGFSKNVMNKITNIVFLKDYTVEDYKKILTESSISPLCLKSMQLNSMGIEFDCDDDFINYLAEEAYKLKIGVYGLIKIINNVFQNYEFSLLSDDIESITIKNKKIIKQRAKKRNY